MTVISVAANNRGSRNSCRNDEGVLFGDLKLKAGVGKRVRQDSELSDSVTLDVSQLYKGLRIGQKVSRRLFVAKFLLACVDQCT